MPAAGATSHVCPLDTCHGAGSNAQDTLHFEDSYEKGVNYLPKNFKMLTC